MFFCFFVFFRNLGCIMMEIMELIIIMMRVQSLTSFTAKLQQNPQSPWIHLQLLKRKKVTEKRIRYYLYSIRILISIYQSAYFQLQVQSDIHDLIAGISRISIQRSRQNALGNNFESLISTCILPYRIGPKKSS